MPSTIRNQLIPLSALQRWVAQLIDPIFRDPGKGFDIDTIIDNLKTGIPGLSKQVPPFRDPLGRPSERPLPSILTPLNVGTESKFFERKLQIRRFKQGREARKTRIKNKIRKIRGLPVK